MSRVLTHTDRGLRALPPPMPPGHSVKVPCPDLYAECLAAVTMAAGRADELCFNAREAGRDVLAQALSELVEMLLAGASALETAELLEHALDAADRLGAS